MEKNVGYLLVIVSVLFLLVGGLVGFNMGEAETITETETIYQNVSVPGEIEYISLPSELDRAVAEFLIAVEDEEDEAGNDVDVLGSYDFNEIEVSRLYNDYSVEYDDEITTVDFSIKLRYDEDGEASVKRTYNVSVIFDLDEDTIVNYVIA